ncbi:MAG: TRAP transporter small permease [Rubrivivax sp.]|jgi:TRAP-type C4-dicarboxylate transport system permease small subunit|nr:TRAP transporter small permease [Rubrivivax sp.]
MAASGPVERVLGVLCAVPVALIVVLTFADVFARYLFAAPIRGSLEIVEFSMALLIFMALPLVTRHRGHVTVSLIDNVVRGPARRIKAVLCDALSTVALALMAWRLWAQGLDDLDAGKHSIVLGWPHAPLTFALAACATLAAMAMAGLAWQSLQGREDTR